MKDIDKYLTALTKEQKKYILEQLKLEVFGSISKSINVCPCCGEENFIKHGSYKDTQKFKCKSTSKIFSYRTSFVVSRVRKLDKFERLMDFLVDSKKFPTLDDIQEFLSVSRKSACDWRRKILTSIYEKIKFDNQLIEFDETNFRISRKGRQGMLYSRRRGGKLVGDSNYNVKVFMVYSRTTGKIELYQSHMGRTSSQDLENYLGVNESITVYSDRHRSYKKYYKKRRVLHRTFISSDHVSKWNKKVHNQTVNYHTRELKKFLDKDLLGVSTKYLQGYLNWYMFIHNCKKEVGNIKEVVMENRAALEVFRQKEKEFQYFLKLNGRNNYGTFKDRYYGKTKRKAA